LRGVICRVIGALRLQPRSQQLPLETIGQKLDKFRAAKFRSFARRFDSHAANLRLHLGVLDIGATPLANNRTRLSDISPKKIEGAVFG